ncbi:VacJ [Eikenella sp. S3360]|uniref:VacJ n=1 Tax=Eikenella glucosivorans TaxID=2766967 RepID=A0ABS0N9X0_9NEIS|nr:VacJ [Eikenella glucosivorans]MBH5329097.1 VacJ [Eikenella glucosivorans]
MYEVNRSLFRLVPLQPFWNWLDSLPDTDLSGLTLQEMQDHANAYLINPCDDLEEVWAEIKPQIEAIFAAELADWCEDESQWPDLHPDIFAEWFHIQFSPIVGDLSAREVEREPYAPIAD